ncbi:hypothetical protein [Vibrio coralliilyticus]|uniref:hypothetical protein n=1 Tax=Vibrio coralliilyticus TaxID=190893 RepID=UPI001E4FE1DE|nr:hypothetical protein [Vibrio coralliilyticus]MCC2524956.1 hypothetical protein [Vibrio coralliilyticus]
MSRYSSVESDLHITISEQLLDNADLDNLIFKELPNQFSRLKDKRCSINELIELQKFIDLNQNILKNNISIAIRLCGGLSAFAKSSNMSAIDVQTSLEKAEYEILIAALCSHVGKTSEWFSTGRVYYSERQMSAIRKKNIAVIVSCLSGYPKFVSAVSEQLGPIKAHYVKVLEGSKTPHGARICRLIESILGLPLGTLDLSQAKFERVVGELFN